MFRTSALLVTFWLGFGIIIVSGCRGNARDAGFPGDKTGFDAALSDGPKNPEKADWDARVLEAKAFCRKKGLNTESVIFVDLGLNSGSYRCFVVRLFDGEVQMKGLVTHGSGKTGIPAGERKYSNEEGSLLSALGKYKTGVSYQGQFGLAYKLYGLDSANSNAFKRYIVLHGHECVPESEVDEPLCQSWGCPTVSPGFLRQLKKVLDHSGKPVLLWVYDSVNR